MKPLLARTLLLTTLLGVLLAPLASAQSRQYKPKELSIPADVDPEEVKDAGNLALEQLVPDALASQGLPKKLAVLPLKQDVDGDYFTVQLSNLFTKIGVKNGFEIYTRDNAQWDSLLQEIQWGDQYGDTMDQATIQKFGRIKGVEALVIGRVHSISKGPDGKPVARLGIQILEVETGRQLWGDEVKGTLPAKPTFTSKIDSLPGGWLTIGGIVGLILFFLILRTVLKNSRPR